MPGAQSGMLARVIRSRVRRTIPTPAVLIKRLVALYTFYKDLPDPTCEQDLVRSAGPYILLPCYGDVYGDSSQASWLEDVSLP